MISQICNVKQQKSIEEQISLDDWESKRYLFFGGLGSMSLGSVNAQYLKRKQIPFKGFIVNRAFIKEVSHLGKPDIPKDLVLYVF